MTTKSAGTMRRYREQLYADPKLAAAKLRLWLSGGGLWCRRRLLRTHAIKRADVLTRTLKALVRAGDVEVVQGKSGRRPVTYYRLRAAAPVATPGEPQPTPRRTRRAAGTLPGSVV